MEDGRCMNILAGFTSSLFENHESYIETDVDLVADDIRLVSDKYISSLITSEITQGIYIFGLSEDLLRNLQLDFDGVDNAIYIEFDDISMKSKLVVRPGFRAIRFDENSFFSNFLGFFSHWDYKHYNKDISQKFVNLSTIKKEIEL